MQTQRTALRHFVSLALAQQPVGGWRSFSNRWGLGSFSNRWGLGLLGNPGVLRSLSR